MQIKDYDLVDSEIRRITLKIVRNHEDLKSVGKLRYLGYRGVFADEDSVWDELDDSPHSNLLLAMDCRGVPIGTTRILDSRLGRMDIDRFSVEYQKRFRHGTSFAEATRFVALGSEDCSKRAAQLALWKAILVYALATRADHVLACSKRGPHRGYEYLLFKHVSGCGYTHTTLASKHHEVYCLNIKEMEQDFREAGHPLHSYLFLEDHTNLQWCKCCV